MLQQITLVHFQSHRITSIKFHPGVNVILGASDSGKSAIVRALRWVCFNRPAGDAFRSHTAGKEKTSVTIRVDDKDISRIRGNTANLYQIGEKDYQAVGREPPEDVTTHLNITEDNFQSQLDSPYLLNLSGGDLARELNGIAHLEVIDRALANCRGELLECGRSLTSLEQRITETDTQLNGFLELDEVIRLRDSLVKLKEKVDGNTAEANLLRQIVTQYNALQGTLDLKDDYEAITKVHNRVTLISGKLSGLKAETKPIQTIVDELKELDLDLESREPLKRAQAQLFKCRELVSGIKQKQYSRDQLTITVDFIQLKTTRIKDDTEKQARLQIELKEKMPKTCPTCGAPINEERRRHILCG